MLKKVYTTPVERIEIINSMVGMKLVEDAIHTNEKYLLFISPEETEPYVLETQILSPTEINILGQQLVEKDLQILELQQENQILGQQIVDIDLRLLTGGM
jgi:hypothetical protein